MNKTKTTQEQMAEHQNQQAADANGALPNIPWGQSYVLNPLHNVVLSNISGNVITNIPVYQGITPSSQGWSFNLPYGIVYNDPHKDEYDSLPVYIKSFIEELTEHTTLYSYSHKLTIAKVFKTHTDLIKFNNKLEDILNDE